MMKNWLKEITALTEREHEGRAERVILVHADTEEWKEWRHQVIARELFIKFTK